MSTMFEDVVSVRKITHLPEGGPSINCHRVDGGCYAAELQPPRQFSLCTAQLPTCPPPHTHCLKMYVHYVSSLLRSQVQVKRT